MTTGPRERFAPDAPGRRGRQPWALVGLSVLLLFGSPRPLFADWKADEAYVKRLERRLAELKASVALFERHRRELELVEAEIATVQLGLADPRGKPDELVRRLLREAYPRVSIRMEGLATKAPEGIGVWTWRCHLTGATSELRWATQLLRQKGLFILPSAKEPVKLTLDPDQRRGSLIFVGHHVRLTEIHPKQAPKDHSAGDIFAKRTDPIAARVKLLRAQIARLRDQVTDIRGFEARVNSIKQYIGMLARLTKRASDPFQAITPVLDLELVRFGALEHRGDQVVIDGAALSPSARDAAQSWLRSLSQRGLRYRADRLQLLYGAPTGVELSVPDTLEGSGPPCTLYAAAARAVDVGMVAASRGAVVACGAEGAATGRVRDLPCERALLAMAHAARAALIRDGRDALLVPLERAEKARQALRRSKARPGGKHLALSQAAPYGQALALLRSLLGWDSLEAPRASVSDPKPTWLVGKGTGRGWLRLLAAARGLEVAGRKRSPQLRPPGRPSTTYPVPEPSRPAGGSTPTAATQLPLSQLRLRLLVQDRAGHRLAVVTDAAGVPRVVRRGTFLGRNRSQVVRIDESGLTLLWSGGPVTARVVLPLGVESGPAQQ